MTYAHSTLRERARRIPGWGVVLLAGAAVGALYAESPAPSPPSAQFRMTPPADYPVVRVAVNEHLRRVAQQSTYRFDFSGVADMSSKVIHDPVVVEYAGDGGSAFRLGPAGFVALGQSGGWVYNVTIALPDGSQPLGEAYRTAVIVDGTLPGTRWLRTGGPLPTLERVGAGLRDPTAGAGDYGLGRWRFRTAELTLTLKRTATRGTRTGVPGRAVPEDLYVVEVNVYDGSRRRAYIRRTFDIRRAQQHGNETDALPLDRVLDDSTPVPPPAPR